MSRKVIERLTERIIEELEKGNIPWSKPWNASPKNFVTKKEYNGYNRLVLGIEAMNKGYSSPYWLTFKQAQQLKGRVKKGAVGVPIIYWNITEKEKENEEGEIEKKQYVFTRYYVVFNLDQIEGIKVDSINEQLEKPQAVVDRYINNNKPLFIKHGGDKAFYSPDGDYIQIPHIDTFKDSEHYYKTLFHEMAHSTGHKTRLNRINHKRFGDENYSKEELIAELTSIFLASHCGFKEDIHVRDSAAYCKGWLRVLKNNKKMIISAAQKAQKAYDYILK